MVLKKLKAKKEPAQQVNNQKQEIYCYVYNDPDTKFSSYEGNEFLSKDDFYVYVFVALSSKEINNHSEYLKKGVENIENVFNKLSDKEIFDRMKEAIYETGDILAGELNKKYSDLEDVDFSTAIIAYKGNVMYVWVDGMFNVRMYRGDESILLNEYVDREQFWGSTKVETGDIISVSKTKYIETVDHNFEDYVLEKRTPTYPSMYIDYQSDEIEMDYSSMEFGIKHPEDTVTEQEDKKKHEEVVEKQPVGVDVNESVEDKDEISINQSKTNVDLDQAPSKPDIIVDDSGIKQISEEKKAEREAFKNLNKKDGNNEDFENGDSQKSKNKKLKFASVDLLNKSKDQFKKGFEAAKSSGFKDKLKSAWRAFSSYVDNLTSKFLDFIYINILKKNKQQIKQFQASKQKKYLQIFVVVFVVFLVSYLFYGVVLKGSGEGGQQENVAAESSGDTQLLQDINTNASQLRTLYNSSNVAEFNQLYKSTSDQIESYISSPDAEGDALNEVIQEIDGYYYELNGISPIAKVNELYLADGVENASIVDFDVFDGEIYAIDKANSQVLKANTASGFDVLGSDESIADMNQIECAANACFITDAEKGIISFDLSSKQFSVVNGLASYGAGVIQMESYSIPDVGTWVYTLVPSEAAVNRFGVSGSTLNQPTKWNNVQSFGANTVDFAIDGNIYELNEQGDLRIFRSGFNIQAGDPAFGELQPANPKLGQGLKIEASAALEVDGINRNRFYIADSSNNMVAVYNKDPKENKFNFLGKYMYTGPDRIKFDNFKDIELSDNDQYLYILEDNMVYQIQVSEL